MGTRFQAMDLLRAVASRIRQILGDCLPRRKGKHPKSKVQSALHRWELQANVFLQ